MLALLQLLPREDIAPTNITRTPDNSRIYGIILTTRMDPKMRLGGVD